MLDAGHTVNINEIVCATFGHGFKADNVKHDYFGTIKVVEDL